MRIAIAGATGLVGSAIARSLEAAGHAITRIGRAPGSDVVLDLARPGALAPGALAGCEALIHAAGVTDEDFQYPAAAKAKAGEGARALLEAAAAAGVARLAYISSAHVYGPLEGRLDEASPERPASPYARAHLATEQLFRAARAEVLVARPCAVYGMPPALGRFARWSLIPFDFPRAALSGRIVLKSAGLQRRNFVPAEGLGQLVGWWLSRPAAGITIANAPGVAEMAVYEFARLCARIALEEAGVQAAIERPAPGGAAAPPLEYRTRIGGHLPGPSLEDHVRELVRALHEKARP